MKNLIQYVYFHAYSFSIIHPHFNIISFSEAVVCIIFSWCKTLQEATDSSHALTESLAVVSAGEVQMPVEVKVVRRQLSHPQDRLLTLLFDWPSVSVLLLRLLH